MGYLIQLSFITSSEFHMSKIMARCNLTLEVFTYSYHTNAKDEIKSYILQVILKYIFLVFPGKTFYIKCNCHLESLPPGITRRIGGPRCKLKPPGRG